MNGKDTEVFLKDLSGGTKWFTDFDYTTFLSEEEVFFEKPFIKLKRIKIVKILRRCSHGSPESSNFQAEKKFKTQFALEA